MSVVLAKEYRGKIVENIYHGDWVICNTEGEIVYSDGNPYKTTYFRSAAKPIQALPIVEQGIAEHYGFTEAELAVMCASHSSEDIHIRTVQSILDKIGLDYTDIQCGIQHTCSGKHAGMLGHCLYHGWDLHNYLDIDHPLQQLLLATISKICSYEQQIQLGIDGCGVPVFALPLHNMAWSWAKLADPSSLSSKLREAVTVITTSMVNYPQLVAGTNRFNTDLLKGFLDIRLIAKSGADAIYCFGLPDRGWGCALKLEAGNSSCLPAIILAILGKLGYSIKDDLLAKYQPLVVRNHLGSQVGEIVPDISRVSF